MMIILLQTITFMKTSKTLYTVFLQYARGLRLWTQLIDVQCKQKVTLPFNHTSLNMQAPNKHAVFQSWPIDHVYIQFYN